MDPRLSDHVRENKITRASRQLQYARRYPEAHEPFPTTRPRSTDSAVPSLAPHPPVHAANPLRERIVTPKIQGLTFSIPLGFAISKPNHLTLIFAPEFGIFFSFFL